MTELVSLDLYMNNISGSIPSSLGNLKKLRFLYEPILSLFSLQLLLLHFQRFWYISMLLKYWASVLGNLGIFRKKLKGFTVDDIMSCLRRGRTTLLSVKFGKACNKGVEGSETFQQRRIKIYIYLFLFLCPSFTQEPPWRPDTIQHLGI